MLRFHRSRFSIISLSNELPSNLPGSSSSPNSCPSFYMPQILQHCFICNQATAVSKERRGSLLLGGLKLHRGVWCSGPGTKHPRGFQRAEVTAGQPAWLQSPRLGLGHDICFLPTPSSSVETEHINERKMPEEDPTC